MSEKSNPKRRGRPPSRKKKVVRDPLAPVRGGFTEEGVGYLAGLAQTGVSQRELARRLHRDPKTVSRTLAKLSSPMPKHGACVRK